MSFTTVCMIGLGYIGLPTAALFASRKTKVIGVDVVPDVVDTINQGKIHIVEPELDILVHASVTEGYLHATLKPESADAFLVAVPTPFKNDHEPDLTYIEAASRSIAPALKKGDLVILESTSPVGTTEQMAEWLSEARSDLTFPQQAGEVADVQIAYCPEWVLPGKVVHELVSNDRIIGGMTTKATTMATELYKVFVEGDCIATNARTAEMCKLTENSFRDVNIAFANELSIICDKLDFNIWELISLANHHPRVNILQPGAGVGGHCIAVDPWFIVDTTPNEARIIRIAREINDHKPHWVMERVKSAVFDLLTEKTSRTINDVKVACLGLAFKPNIDDLRESPAVEITQLIAELGCQVVAVEPHIDALPKALDLPNVALAQLEDALQQTDVVCLLVRHSAFVEAVKAIGNKSLLIDAVGLIEIGARK